MAPSQRTQRFYRAESMVHRMVDNANRSGSRSVEMYGSHLTLPEERRFGDLDGIRRYVRKVLALNWVRESWPEASAEEVRVSPRKPGTQLKASYSRSARGGHISIPEEDEGFMRETLVLHELAHHLSGDAGHGDTFLSTYGELVEGIIGPEMRFIMETVWRDAGVSPS